MTRRGWWLFSLMAVLWGIPYLLIRVAVRQIDPTVLVLGRTGPAALLLAPLVTRQRAWGALRRNLGWIIAFAVVEFGVPWFFMATAEEHISSSLTSLLICAVPLISVLASRFTSHHERVSARRWLGLALGAVGVALLVGLDLSGGSLEWMALMGVVCVGYALGPLVLTLRLSQVPGVAVVCGATGFVALVYLPVAISRWPHHVGHETVAAVATLSVLCTAGAFVTFFELIKEVGSSRSTVVVYSNTAIAVLLGIVGLHEAFTVGIALGFPLIVVGSFLATSSARHSSRDANLVAHD